jgi:hypothetical protein
MRVAPPSPVVVPSRTRAIQQASCGQGPWEPLRATGAAQTDEVATRGQSRKLTVTVVTDEQHGARSSGKHTSPSSSHHCSLHTTHLHAQTTLACTLITPDHTSRASTPARTLRDEHHQHTRTLLCRSGAAAAAAAAAAASLPLSDLKN